MSDDSDPNTILRTNIRLLLKHDPIHNATSLSKQVLGRGKDYLNDFLNEKDGTFKKSSLGADELLEIAKFYSVALVDLKKSVFNDYFVRGLRLGIKHGMDPFEKLHTRTMLEDVEKSNKQVRKLIGSFDPDDSDDGAVVGESRIRVVGQTDDAPTERPLDAICELVSRAGLGDGEEIETEWVQDGDGHKQVDALRSDYWRFPRNFLQKELKRVPKQLMVVECDGDSMEPTLTSGSRVVVDVSHTSPSPDGLYAIRDHFGAIRVKRLQVSLSGPPRVHVLSDNPSHHTQEIDLADLFVVGRVVGAIRTF